MQGDWIINLMEHMRGKQLTVVNALPEDEKKWADGVWTIANQSLLPSTKSVSPYGRAAWSFCC